MCFDTSKFAAGILLAQVVNDLIQDIAIFAAKF